MERDRYLLCGKNYLLLYNLFTALKRTLKGRMAMLNDGMADWAMGEAFAFGSLLQDGKYVRLSGKIC